jgi:ATP-dependent DNA ligase
MTDIIIRSALPPVCREPSDAWGRVHWVRPELVTDVKFLTWTDDNLLRQVVYEGPHEDKPAREVRRESPHAKQ